MVVEICVFIVWKQRKWPRFPYSIWFSHRHILVLKGLTAVYMSVTIWTPKLQVQHIHMARDVTHKALPSPPPPGRMTVRRKCSPEQKPSVHHQHTHVSNRFSQLSDAPTEKQTLAIGSSIWPNMKLSTQAAIAKCIPGVRQATRNHISSCWPSVNVNTIRL